MGFVTTQAIRRAFGSAQSPRTGLWHVPSVVWHSAKTVMSVVVAALSLTTLVAMLVTINVENTQGLTRYWSDLKVDYVVSQTGFDSEVYNASLPPKLVADLRKQPNLRVSFMSVLFAKQRSQDVVYMAFEPGGPAQPQMYTGRYLNSDREVVVDRDLAPDLGIKLGDTAVFAGVPLRAVGLSDQTDAIARRRIFVTPEAFKALSGALPADPIIINMAAIQGQPSASLVKSWSSTHTFYTKARWVQGLADYGWRNFTPLIYMMVLACVLLGIISYVNLIRVQMRFARRHVSLLRMLGATVSQVVRAESLALFYQTVLGMLFGLVVGTGAIAVVAGSTPGFHAGLTVATSAITASLVLIVTSIAGVLPVWLIVRKANALEVYRQSAM